MKIIKIFILIFCFTFTGQAFGKSPEYYRATLAHVLTKCNSKCQKKVFDQEVHRAFFVLIDAILNQVQFELSQKKKEKLWSKEF